MRIQLYSRYMSKYNDVYLNRNMLLGKLDKIKTKYDLLSEKEKKIYDNILIFFDTYDNLLSNCEKYVNKVILASEFFNSDMYQIFDEYIIKLSEPMNKLANLYLQYFVELQNLIITDLQDDNITNVNYDKNNFYEGKYSILNDYDKKLIKNTIPLSNNLDFYSIKIDDSYLNDINNTLLLSKISKTKANHDIDRFLKSNNTHEVIVFNPNYGTLHYKTDNMNSNSPNRDFETNTPLSVIDIKTFDCFKGELVDRKSTAQPYVDYKVSEDKYNPFDPNYLNNEDTYIEDLNIQFRNNLSDLIESNESYTIAKIRSDEAELLSNGKNYTIRLNPQSSRDITYTTDNAIEIALLNTATHSVENAYKTRYPKDQLTEHFIDNDPSIKPNPMKIIQLDDRPSKLQPTIHMHITSRDMQDNVAFSSNIPSINETDGSILWNSRLIYDYDVAKYGNILSTFSTTYGLKTTNQLWKDYVHMILPVKNNGIIPTYMWCLYDLSNTKHIEQILLVGNGIRFTYRDFMNKLHIREFEIGKTTDNNTFFKVPHDVTLRQLSDIHKNQNLIYDDTEFKQYNIYKYYDLLGKPYRHIMRTKYYASQIDVDGIPEHRLHEVYGIDLNYGGNLSTIKLNLAPNKDTDSIYDSYKHNSGYTSIEAI